MRSVLPPGDTGERGSRSGNHKPWSRRAEKNPPVCELHKLHFQDNSVSALEFPSVFQEDPLLIPDPGSFQATLQGSGAVGPRRHRGVEKGF